MENKVDISTITSFYENAIRDFILKAIAYQQQIKVLQEENEKLKTKNDNSPS